MITYPSTHGVFEETIRRFAKSAEKRTSLHGRREHERASRFDSPALSAADVCHLNLHKTFCIPHGGGGPGCGRRLACGTSRGISCPATTSSISARKSDRRRRAAQMRERAFSRSRGCIAFVFGRGRTDQGDQVRHPQRDYIARAFEKIFPTLYRSNGPRRARVHSGSARVPRHDRRGRGETG